MSQRCHEYCCSEMAGVDDTYFDYTSDLLSNGIHPIFTPENLPSGANYKVLIPILQLSTMLMETEGYRDYVSTMAAGQLRKGHGGNSLLETMRRDSTDATQMEDFSHVYAQLRPEQQPESALLARTFLLDLAAVVRFGWFEDAVANEGCPHADGSYSCPDDEGLDGEEQEMVLPDATTAPLFDPMPKTQSPSFTGCGSYIFLNREVYKHVVFLHECEENREDDCGAGVHWRLLCERFVLAVILVHEIAHAVQNAVFGGHKYEVFYTPPNGADIIMSEAGFTAVAQIFGGTIESYTNDGSSNHCGPTPEILEQSCAIGKKRPYGPFLVIERWPSNISFMRYTHLGHPCGMNAPQLIHRDQVTRVPIGFIAKLFTNHFWRVTVPEEGQNALLAPPFASWTFKFDSEGARRAARYTSIVEIFGEEAHEICPCAGRRSRQCSKEVIVVKGGAEDVLTSSSDNITSQASS